MSGRGRNSTIAIVLGLVAALIGAATTYADDAPPRVMSLDEQIARCQEQSGDERDMCLANLALFHRDSRPCRAAPEGRCAEWVGKVLVQRCAQENEGLAVSTCEIMAASELNFPDACDHASDPRGCLAGVAAALEDPQIIIDRVDDPRERDKLLGMYAGMTGDEGVLDMIENNNIHDLASTYIVSKLGAGADKILPSDYCDRLRGNYTGPDAGDENVNLNVCKSAVIFSNWLVERTSQVETDAELDQLLDDYQEMLEGIDSGEIDIGELVAGWKLQSNTPRVMFADESTARYDYNANSYWEAKAWTTPESLHLMKKTVKNGELTREWENVITISGLEDVIEPGAKMTVRLDGEIVVRAGGRQNASGIYWADVATFVVKGKGIHGYAQRQLGFKDHTGTAEATFTVGPNTPDTFEIHCLIGNRPRAAYAIYTYTRQSPEY